MAAALLVIVTANSAIINFLTAIWLRAAEIVKQPSVHKDMLWILLPLLVTLILIELYFGRYKHEKLGWSTALGNSLVLFFVGMNLLSWLHGHNLLLVDLIKTAIASFIVVEAAALILINFFHLIPARFAFGISSVLVLNFIGIIAIILVYSGIALNGITVLASAALFVLLAALIKGLQLMETKSTAKEELELPELPE